MIQAGDGTLVPWVSDGGKPMRIAAAQPDIPWTDLAYSLQPNGHTLDYVVDSPYLKRGRIGVMKQSFVAGLYATGQAISNYAPPGTDPDADLIDLVRVDQRRRALRPEPAVAGHRRRDHQASLLLLHRRLDGARAAADLERLHRRPVPARRGDPLLQPHARRPPRHAGLADVQRPRPPARAEQDPRRHLPQPPAAQLVRLLRQGHGPGAVPGRADPDADLRRRRPAARPGRSTTRTPTSRSGPRRWADLAPGEVRFTGRGLEGDRARRSATRPARPSTRSAAAAPARPRPAPTRPAPPATASTRRRPAASR